MYSLPTSITIEGQSFTIRDNGDFRMVLDCFDVMNDLELNEQEQVLVMLMIFYDGMDTIEDLERLPNLAKAQEEMYKFFNCGKIDEYQISKPKLIDWNNDSELICSAINNVAKKEIRAEAYLHWWTFLGYFSELGEGLFSTVLHIRQKRAARKQLSAAEKEFVKSHKEIIDIVPKRSAAELAERARLNELLNGGEGVSQTVI